MHHTIETERLFLRELIPADAHCFYLLNLDPEVLRFTGDVPFPTEASARFFLKNYTPYASTGLGRWAVLRKSDHAFLGWCGLRYDAKTDETDLGFRFFKTYWNQGYATEAAKASLAYGFLEKKLSCIIGRAMIANKASIRVLEKIGMTYWKDIDFEGHVGAVYRSQRPSCHTS